MGRGQKYGVGVDHEYDVRHADEVYEGDGDLDA